MAELDDHHPYRSPAGLTPARVVAFSDGVFAIALTLLVLGLDVPPGTTDAELGRVLVEESGQLAIYALSFVVISMFWLIHHRLFSHIMRVDRTLLVLNLVALGFVALIPFPTEVLGDYSASAAGSAFYALVVACTSLAVAAVSGYAFRAGLTADTATRSERLGWVRGVGTSAVFLLSVPLCLLGASVAQLSWLLAIPVGMAIHHAVGADGDVDSASAGS